MTMTIKAKAVQYTGNRLPELILYYTIPASAPQDLRIALMEWLLKNGTWEVLDNTDPTHPLVFASYGMYGTSRRIRLNPEGRYQIRLTTGVVKFDWFGWDHSINQFLPPTKLVVPVNFQYESTGNIQWGYAPLDEVKEAILQAGLPFEATPSGVLFTGEREVLRAAKIYPNAHNKLTWGVNYSWRAFEGAGNQDDWAGALWPDEKTAKQVADDYIKSGTRDMCATFEALRAKFPDHPVIAKLAKMNIHIR